MYSIRTNPPEAVLKNLEAYDSQTIHLLYARGIETAEEAKEFLERKWEQQDAFAYAHMERAVARTLEAIERGEEIGLYSDYDCDGIPAAAALFSALRAFGHTGLHHYTPNRNTDGFGIHNGGVQQLAQRKVSLAFVIDCGTAHPEGIAAMQQAGMDVIVLDHHLPGDVLPEPYAMINPALEWESDSHPCAAGVVYLFIQALVERAQTSALPTKPALGWEKWQLDLIALATISDMVTLRGFNRQLVHYGLSVARKSPRPGLQALCRTMRIKQERLTQEDVSFSIIPRINAASRMGHADVAFALLTTDNMEEALAHATTLDTLNNRRKSAVAAMVRAAQKQVAHKDMEAPVWVFGDRGWKPSLAGLVAQKIASLYDKAVFVWGQSEGDANAVKGSCRSATHDVFTMMQECTELFEECGGHKHAGGFTLTQSAEIPLEERLNTTQAAKGQATTDTLIDFACSVDEFLHIVKSYTTFSPFGCGNENITVLLKGCVPSQTRSFGKHKEHLQFQFAGATGSVSGVCFFAKEEQKALSVAGADAPAVDVVGMIDWDSFRQQPRLRILDIAKA